MMLFRLFSPQTLRLGLAGIALAGAMLIASVNAYAQQSVADGGAGSGVSIVPRVSISETLTNNVRLSSSGQQSDQITEISPGIRISGEGGRVSGYFDYSLKELVYAQNSSPNRSQNELNTFGTVEAVDNWAYLDFNGSISQQAVSAFGTLSSGNTAINSNQTEVSSYRISPYVRGQLRDLANYEARYSRYETRSDAAAGSGVTSSDGIVKVNGRVASNRLGWSVDVSQQNTDYSAGRTTVDDRASFGLSTAVTPQLTVSVNGGRESNNFTSIDKKSYGTSGFGVTWSPSETTKLSASRENRSFGSTHNVIFEHRTGLTAWRFSDTKNVATTPNQDGVPTLGSVYDLLYLQFESVEPDPIARARLVSAFLQANGVDPNAIAVSSFLTSALTLQRRQELSFALLGVRDTVTFTATRSENTRLDTVSAGIDDLTTNALVRQRGFSVNYSHRLTPDYSLGVLLSQQNTSGLSGLQETRLRSLNVNVSGKVGKRATASMGIRRVVFDGAAPYLETAVIGTLIIYF